MRKEPVLGWIALTNCENKIVVRIQVGVPLPQAVLPVLVFVEKEPVDVFGVDVRDKELRRSPIRDTHLPQCRA
uniref:Uncharacterized protein n=1 Tax=Arundo donax TaxID=35708 RepID=A0A0A8Z5N7_ARUDO